MENSRDAGGDTEAQLELLAEENRRLREQSRRLRQSQYRRTAIGLGTLGVIAGAGAAVFPIIREILLALAGIGLFSAVMVYFLTPERFVAASVSESIYGAYARNARELVADLGLEDIQVYIPGKQGTRLFIPQHVDYRIPDDDDLEGVLLVPQDERQRGISLQPTGGELITEFKRTLSDEPADEPAELGRQLADALVEVFELADSASVSSASAVDNDDGTLLAGPAERRPEHRITIGTTGNIYGDGPVIDHPVTSVVACGIAQQLGQPVVADVTSSPDSDVDYLMTFYWQNGREE